MVTASQVYNPVGDGAFPVLFHYTLYQGKERRVVL